jgi:hypothetical protein
MPYQNTCCVHCLIKLIFFELTTSPQSEHVESTEESVISHFLVGLKSGPGKGHFRGNVVGSSYVEVVSVEVESERGAVVSFVCLLNNCNCSNACCKGVINGFKIFEID